MPALITLSVVGRVDLTPADPLDERIGEAFNAHQRRTTGGRRLLGPDARDLAADLFTRRGVEVLVRSSPWRLGRGVRRADDGMVDRMGRRGRVSTIRGWRGWLPRIGTGGLPT